MRKIVVIFFSCICFWAFFDAMAEDSVNTESSVVMQENVIEDTNTNQEIKKVAEEEKDNNTKSPTTSLNLPKESNSKQTNPGAYSNVGKANMDLAWFLVCSFGIIALIYFIAWLLKKMKFLPNINLNKKFRTLGVISLGAKEKLVLVKVGNEQIVVGVTPQNITMVHKLSEPIENENITEDINKNKSEGQNSFAALFQKLSGTSQAKSNSESSDNSSK